MYITRVKMLNNHGSQIIDWIKAIWAVFKIFWSNFCFHRIMWRHYSFASFSLPKGSSLFLTTFVQLSNPTVFNSPSHLTLSPHSFTTLFLPICPTFPPTFSSHLHPTFSHYIFSQELTTNRSLSHHSPNSLNPVLSLFLTFILTFLPSPPPPSYFHCPLTRPLPLVLLGAKAKRVSN